jgi:hypothetical protein
VITLPVFVLAFSIALVVADGLDRDSARAKAREVLRRPGFVRVLALVALAVVLLGPVTFLLGVYLVIRWSAAPVLTLDGDGSSAAGGQRVRAALRGSSALTKGHRLRTGAVLGLALLIAALTGPLVGALTMIVTPMPLGYVNVLSSLISAVLVPWLAIVVIMLQRNLVR